MSDRPEILLSSGHFFNYLTPESSVITINDLARGLANESRYNGQTCRFYSVAQHSVLVSMIVPPEHAMAGLLHDGSEAVMKDLPKPLKRLLPDYQQLEKRVEAAIFAKFGITLPLHPSIKEADIILLATEKRDLMPPHEHWDCAGVSPLKLIIEPMPPAYAEQVFLERYYYLIGQAISATRPQMQS